MERRRRDMRAAVSKGRAIRGPLAEARRAAPFLLPGLVLVALFVILPIALNVVVSFSDYKIMARRLEPAGFANYASVFGDSQGRLWYALRNNVLYSIAVTSVSMFLGLVLAVLVNSVSRGKVLVRTLYYLPVVTSWVIVGLVFRYLFTNGRNGFINYAIVDLLHLSKAYIPWLRQEWTGNIAIWTLGVWKTVGWVVVIDLAALQSIPRDFYEAAQIEGAGAAPRFFRITLPLLNSTTFYIVVNLVIGGFSVLLQVWFLTQGDPNGKTSVLTFFLYERTFDLFKFGEGAAIGLVSAAVVLAVTVVLQRLLKPSETYL
jgi:multiple sugar transport system permease protein